MLLYSGGTIQQSYHDKNAKQIAKTQQLLNQTAETID
jgi:hypothetical protein